MRGDYALVGIGLPATLLHVPAMVGPDLAGTRCVWCPAHVELLSAVVVPQIAPTIAPFVGLPVG